MVVVMSFRPDLDQIISPLSLTTWVFVVLAMLTLGRKGALLL